MRRNGFQVPATWIQVELNMTLNIDTDGDGEPEATFPLRWASLLLIAILTVCGGSEFVEVLRLP